MGLSGSILSALFTRFRRPSMKRPVDIVLILLLVSACLPGDPETKSEGTVRTPEQATARQVTTAPLTIDAEILTNRSFTEAPMLAERVIRGSLPPVAERLPEHPLIVVPMEEIGRYGGAIRRALTGDIVQTPGPSKTLNENLMGYERPMPNSIQFNLAEDYEFQDEGRTAIFRIRKGLKWSDGVPFTVDDILFWYVDMTLNEDARRTPLFPSQWLVESVPILAEKIDDHTIRFSSHKPLGRILDVLCGDEIVMAKHHFARFHPTYNPDATYESLRDSTTRAIRLYQPGTPTLSAWMPVVWERGQRIVYDRNPYYFKVDSAGNQLPYTDRLEFSIIQDPEIILLKFINGEFDLLGRYAQINMYPTLKAEEPKGKFRILLGIPVPVSNLRINWDTPRLPLRRAFRNKQVRMAMSYGLNRQEIGEILYYGLLEPGGFTFAPASRYYSEEAAQMYAQHDPALARRLLDEAGYVDSDDDGVRELDDGSPFTVTIDVIPSMGVDVCQLVAEGWKTIGIDTNLYVALRDIQFPRRANGEGDIWWWWSRSGDPVVRRQDWGIIGPHLPQWHRSAATEGPDWLHEATRLIEESGTTVDTAVVSQNMVRVRDLYTENVPSLSPGYAHHVWGANTRLGNVPIESTTEDGYRGWSRPVFHEQLYIKE